MMLEDGLNKRHKCLPTILRCFLILVIILCLGLSVSHFQMHETMEDNRKLLEETIEKKTQKILLLDGMRKEQATTIFALEKELEILRNESSRSIEDLQKQVKEKANKISSLEATGEEKEVKITSLEMLLKEKTGMITTLEKTATKFSKNGASSWGTIYRADIYGDWLQDLLEDDIVHTEVTNNRWVRYKPLANLIRAWTLAMVDWHHLVPSAKYGDSGELHFVRLVQKEKTTMQMFLNARDNVAIGPYTSTYNPDLQYCENLADKCVVHRNENECRGNSYCRWHPDLLLCIELQPPYPDGMDGRSMSLWPNLILENSVWKESLVKKAKNFSQDLPAQSSTFAVSSVFNVFENVAIENKDNRLTVISYGASFTSQGIYSSYQSEKPSLKDEDCDIYLKETVFLLQFTDDAKMFWHFVTEQLGPIFNNFEKDPANNHIWVFGSHLEAHMPLFDWFALHTLNCYRHTDDLIRRGRTCVKKIWIQTPSLTGSGAGSAADWSSFAVERTLLKDDWFQGNRPRVGFVSRQDKRVFLNEPDLAKAVTEMGADAWITPYEFLPIHLQLAASRPLDVLVGIHGSGLLNTVFMRSGTAEIQVIPVGLDRPGGESYTHMYVSCARQTNVRYFELAPLLQNFTGRHWHFAGSQDSVDYRNRLVSDPLGTLSVGMGFVMLVQQDTIVPVDKLVQTLKSTGL